MKIATDNLNFTASKNVLAELGNVLKVGQVVNATAMHRGNASETVLLRLGQYLLEAKTPVALEDGQLLKLLVKSTGNTSTGSLPQLKLLADASGNIVGTSSSNTLHADRASMAAVKLRQFISVQQSFSQLHQHSQALLSEYKTAQHLPETLKAALSKIQESVLINKNTISAATLKQHIVNSGLFLESKLNNIATQSLVKPVAQQLLNNDLKHQLLTARSELMQLDSSGYKHTLNTNNQALTSSQLGQLLSDIKNIGHQPQELANRLLSVLPRSSIDTLIALLTRPGTTHAGNELLQLANTLAKIIQQPLMPGTEQSSKHTNLAQQLQLRLMLSELAQQVEQSIQKLSSMQLQPLSREENNMMLLLFNLIFKDNSQQFDINFRIEQQDKNSSQEKESWKIDLTFNFKTLGNVQSRIIIQDDSVSTSFHTEKSATADKVQQLLPLLESGLKRAGLQINKLSVSSGLLEQNPMIDRNIKLVDVTA